MAALPISTSTGAIPPRTQVEVTEQPASKVNYLNRCVENITEKAEFQNKVMEGLHLTVAVVTGVVFIAAIIASIVVTAIFAPPSIPFVALGAFYLTPFIQDFISSRLAVSKKSNHKAEVAAEIRKNFDALPKTTISMAIQLQKLGITVHDINSESIKKDILKLGPILAHYNYWHTKSENWAKEAVTKRAEEKIHIQKYPNESKQITELRLRVLALEDGSLATKTNAAFYLGLLRNPEFSRELEDDLITRGSTIENENLINDHLLLGKRALAAQFGDTNEEQFLKISNPSATTLLSRSQVRDLTEDQLRQRLFV